MPQCILVVDDEPDVRELLCLMLEQDGYQAVAAGCGREALERVAALAPALVITDVVMPGVDGYAVLQGLSSRLPGTPALVMSGGGRAGPDIHLEAARRLGASAVVKKPFSRDEILGAVRSLLDRPGAIPTPEQENA